MAIVIVRSSPYSSIHRRSFESAKEVPIIDIGLPPPCPDEGEASALGPIPPYNCQSHNEAGAHLAYIAQPHSLPSNLLFLAFFPLLLAQFLRDLPKSGK